MKILLLAKFIVEPDPYLTRVAEGLEFDMQCSLWILSDSGEQIYLKSQEKGEENVTAFALYIA